MGAQAIDTAIVTLAQAKTRLIGIDNTSKDDQINKLIDTYSGVVSNYCGRKFTSTTYTDEIYDGTDSHSLWLRNWPITTPMDSSHGIWVDSARKFPSGSKLTEDVPSVTAQGHYYVTVGEEGQGEVVRLGQKWPAGRGTIKVSYVAGYAQASIPGPVVEAVLRMIARQFSIAEAGAEAVTGHSGQAGGGSVSFVEHRIPTDVREMLEPYRSERFY